MRENIQNEVNEDHMNIIERYKQYLDNSSTKAGGQNSFTKATGERRRTSTFPTVALQGY